MQEITLKRQIISNKAILGSLYSNGSNKLLCKTLELPYLNNYKNISSIPTGTYKVKKYSSWSFKDVWEIQDVPNRSKILIHIGNTVDDIKGCILVGSKWSFFHDKLAVTNSKATMDNLRRILEKEFVINIEIE